MITYSCSELAKLCGGTLLGPDRVVSQVFIDSRFPGSDNSLFFAIIGKQHNGHQYIEELYSKGIRCFVVHSTYQFPRLTEASFICVGDSLRALQTLAAYHRTRFNYPIVGITGSSGKTIIKEWLFQVLSESIKLVRSPKSYNSQVGVPLSILLMDSSTSLGIFEAGISETNEMEFLEKIIRPDIGIFTNIGEAHQLNFRSVEDKIKEKLKLFIHTKTLIYCYDHTSIHNAITNSNLKCTYYTWGTSPKADVVIVDKKKSQKYTSVTIQVEQNTIQIVIPFTQSEAVENALHCVSFLLFRGYGIDYIRRNIEKLSTVATRLELKPGINSCTVINDFFNNDINSLSIALNFLQAHTQNSSKTLILSDIQDTSIDSFGLYQSLAKLIREKGISRFIGIGPELFAHKHLFSLKNDFYLSVNDFINQCDKTKFYKEDILIKGSGGLNFERISQLLEHKIHQTVLEVNLSALVANLNYYKSKLNPDVKLMAMVKAYSYGIGGQEIASLLQFHRVDYLAVAYADEGIALRNAGIQMRIVVLNPEPDSYDAMIANTLEPEIYNFHSLRGFLHSAALAQSERYPIHLKLDTGMHRLGFNEQEIELLTKELLSTKLARVESVFSHLAASDEEDYDSFTTGQIAAFERMSNLIINKLEQDAPPLRHILNTSGIERFPQGQFDMVRLGIGLYGVSNSDKIQKYLRTVSTLKSAIVQIKEIPEGDTVGYGRKGKVEKNKKIAIVPIGYADGLNRKLGCGNTCFLLNGKLAPTIGNICMDTCMIDITGIDAQEGNQVTIFGNKPTVNSIAESLDTIPYEILTAISQRVKRIYFTD